MSLKACLKEVVLESAKLWRFMKRAEDFLEESDHSRIWDRKEGLVY